MLTSAERGQRQTAYRILVASSEAKLRAGVGDRWDSGKHTGSETIQVPYVGKLLASDQRCWWKVRAWDKDGAPSAWSDPALWAMGILSPSDWKAQWIGMDGPNSPETPAPVFRKGFQVTKQLARAVVYISGLGQFELSINGRRVGDHALDPGWTDYRKTCLYVTHDVTSLLRPGANAIDVMLGNGMYNVQGGRYAKFKGSFGAPKLILQLHLEYVDGTTGEIASDDSWKAAPGPITFNCIFGGEDYDARREQPVWRKAVVVDGPGGRLAAQSAPPVKVMGVFNTVNVTHPKPGVAVYDLGRNFSGRPRIRVRGPAGATVKLTPGELVDSQGLVTQKSSGGPSYFTYTLRGGGEEIWSPRFTYYGFRYVQVEGSPEAHVAAVEGQFLHAAAEVAGTFSSSNPLLDRIHALINAAVLSNFQSVLTDCPHREKLGWLEVAHLMAPSVLYNYDAASFYGKIIDDMGEAQLPNGLVPDIAPEFVVFRGGFRDSPEWGSAYVIAPWMLYQRYGDRRGLEKHYAGMKRYVEYLAASAAGHIVSHGLGDWCDIGPGAPGVSKQTPRGVTGTAIYYLDVTILARIAGLLGRQDDHARFSELASQIRTAFNRRFFHAGTSQYASGSQTANAMPLVLGIAEPARRQAILANIVSDVRSRGNSVTSGDVGHRFLLCALTDGGRPDVVYDMVTKTETPSYGYQLRMGATSLTEAWDANPNLSQNHCMLGHAEEWFYQGLAGIAPAPDAVGFDKILIRPQPVGDLRWVKASHHSVRGEIAVHWRREGGGLFLDVTVPVNASATVCVPASGPDAVTESGRPAAGAAGARYLGMERDAAVYNVGSGSYRFVSSRL